MLPWSLRQESNLYLPLRRRPFYPLNYGGMRASTSPQDYAALAVVQREPSGACMMLTSSVSIARKEAADLLNQSSWPWRT